MPDIQQLPPSVINKIAAGEVIERPASVVKELMENSVDAGATRVDVTVQDGGMELIRVSDNGCGIHPDQLTLAVASHATSKIRNADDLFQVGTLGFRGEALASISEVSQFVIRSRAVSENGSEDTGGFELEVNAGDLQPIQPCGCPIGTTIEVRNLFCNTPVRRKFMRTTQTEMGHISEAFTRIALPHPNVHFTLRHNQRTLQDLPPVSTWRERILAFCGDEFEAGLIPVESRDVNSRLYGFAVDPHFSRGNTRMQYIFLNGRHIRDRALTHALGEAYRGLLTVGRHPIAYLQFDIEPEAVDVNVHPTKLEVRFRDGGRMYSQLLGALRKQFLATDLTARIRSGGPPPVTEAVAGAPDPAASEQQRKDLVAWAKGQIQTNQNTDSEGQGSLDLRFDTSSPLELTHIGQRSAMTPVTSGELAVGAQNASQVDAGVSVSPLPPSPALSSDETVAGEVGPSLSSAKVRPTALQVHNRYLIVEDEAGMLVIDQHALHERILYEMLRKKVLEGAMETQRLLVPEPVSLTSAEAAAVLEAKDTLATIGLEVEPFGGDTVLVSGYPAMLSKLRPAELLRQVLEQLMTAGKTPDRRDTVDELLHMMSCKAAVKAGDHLNPEEIDALLQQRDLCQDAHHCPHGRPTSLVFTRDQLDRMFKRT